MAPLMELARLEWEVESMCHNETVDLVQLCPVRSGSHVAWSCPLRSRWVQTFRLPAGLILLRDGRPMGNMSSYGEGVQWLVMPRAMLNQILLDGLMHNAYCTSRRGGLFNCCLAITKSTRSGLADVCRALCEGHGVGVSESVVRNGDDGPRGDARTRRCHRVHVRCACKQIQRPTCVSVNGRNCRKAVRERRKSVG